MFYKIRYCRKKNILKVFKSIKMTFACALEQICLKLRGRKTFPAIKTMKPERAQLSCNFLIVCLNWVRFSGIQPNTILYESYDQNFEKLNSYFLKERFFFKSLTRVGFEPTHTLVYQKPHS